MTNELIVLPSYYAERIVGCGRPSGLIHIKQDPREALFVVDGYTKGASAGGVRGGSDWVRDHYLAHASTTRVASGIAQTPCYTASVSKAGVSRRSYRSNT